MEYIIDKITKEWLMDTVCGGFGEIIVVPHEDFRGCLNELDITVDGIVRFTTSYDFNIDVKYMFTTRMLKQHMESETIRHRTIYDIDIQCLKTIRSLKHDVVLKHPDIKSMAFIIPRRK